MIQPKNTRCTTCQTINPADASYYWICKSEELMPIEAGPTAPSAPSIEPREKAYIDPFSDEALAQSDVSAKSLLNRLNQLIRNIYTSKLYSKWLVSLVFLIFVAYFLVPLAKFIPASDLIVLLIPVGIVVACILASPSRSQMIEIAVSLLIILLEVCLLIAALIIAFLFICSTMFGGL